MKLFKGFAMAVVASLGLAVDPCPLLGPGYPAPRDLSSNSSSAFKAWNQMIIAIEAFLNSSTVSEQAEDLTFSISAFSLRDPTANKRLQYHRTSASIQNSTVGVKKADGNSIYRVGSISKAFTVYTVLAKLGSQYWQRPVTDFISELAAASNASRVDQIERVDWRTVTLGNLAGQMSGITRDIVGVPPSTPGLPKFNNTSSPNGRCGWNCSRTDLLQEIAAHPPSYKSWTSPVYSNTAYSLLALALEKITGQSFVELAVSDVIQPLGLTSSGLDVPANFTNAVVYGGSTVAWGEATGFEGPAGGFYSSSNDLSKFALSILNSTLLHPETTREWLKPITHTGVLNVSVGRPWEVYRYTQPSTGRVNDLYTKGGDVTGYHSKLIISPDHEAGFVVLTASSGVVPFNTYLADIGATTFLQGLEEAAAAEAKSKLAGVYRSSDASTNSSITLSVNPSSGPGLIIDEWHNRGSNTLDLLKQFHATTRLFPTNRVSRKQASGGGQRYGTTGTRDAVVEQVVFEGANTGTIQPFGPFSSTCNAWELVDALEYGNRSLSAFVFDLDTNGNAVAVESQGFRGKLFKVTK